MNLITAILLFALFFKLHEAAPYSEKENAGRIISGSLASPGQFPYLVDFTENDQHICGGFIYSDRWIVTAATCCYGIDISSMKIKVAEYSLVSPDTDEQWIPVASVKIHPSFNLTNIVHDLALVQLARPIVLGPNAKIIKYDELYDESPAATATIAGWGATMDGGIVTTRLRYATVINTAADCKTLYPTAEYNQNTMICAGDGTFSPCNYDQGSPLVQNGVVAGIMSKNKSCVSGPTIYTRLVAYYNWLIQIAGQQPA